MPSLHLAMPHAMYPQPVFYFPKVEAKAQVCDLSLAYRFEATLWVCSLAIYQRSPSLESKLCTGLRWGMWNTGSTHGPVGRKCRWGLLLCLMDRIPDGVSDAVSRIHTCLMLPESPIWHSLSLFSVQSFSSLLSTLDRVRVKSNSLVFSCTAGEARHSLKCSLFLLREKLWAENIFLVTELCLLGEVMIQVKSSTTFTLSHAYKLVFFAPKEYWNFNSGDLDIHKVSFTHEWLSQCLPGAPRPWSRGTGGSSTRHWSVSVQFMTHSWDQGLYSYYTKHMSARILLGPFAYDTGSHNSHKSSFVHGWLPAYCYWRDNMNKGHLIQPCCWCHAQHKILTKRKKKLYLVIRKNNNIAVC